MTFRKSEGNYRVMMQAARKEAERLMKKAIDAGFDPASSQEVASEVAMDHMNRMRFEFLGEIRAIATVLAEFPEATAESAKLENLS